MHADGLRSEKLSDGKVRRVDHRLGLYIGPHLSLRASHSLGAEVPATGCVPWMGFAVSRRWDESSASSARTTRSRESANKDQERRGIGRFRGMIGNHYGEIRIPCTHPLVTALDGTNRPFDWS